MSEKYRTFDPFARVPLDNAGDVSDKEDTSKAEAEAIEPYIPSEASTEEGYKKMLEIMKKTDPSTQEDKKSPSTTTINPATQKQKPKQKKAILTEMPQATTPDSATKKEDEQEFTQEEILPLLDSLLTKGVVRETFEIRGSRVVFRTQFFWEDQLAMKLTEENLNPNSLRDTGALVNSLYVLSMNLEQFGGNYFKPISHGKPRELRESLESRAEFLQTLPSVLINYLWEKRGKFFKKVEYISKNFDKLIEAF